MLVYEQHKQFIIPYYTSARSLARSLALLSVSSILWPRRVAPRRGTAVSPESKHVAGRPGRPSHQTRVEWKLGARARVPRIHGCKQRGKEGRIDT